MSFNDRLKQRRKEKKLTQKEIAPLLGIKQNTYSDWETGKSEPNLENVVKLSKILGTTTDELLGQTIYPKVDLLRFLDDFDVSNIKDFTKSDVDKLKFAIMFEITRNKVNALNLKDDLILKYRLNKDEREILNIIFSEVQEEMNSLFNFK
ncbi:helix-turn-helix domain-containing protein [Streptococcus dysgalactiae]|uniref:HTH-type transcriptional regulator AnsR family protein n=1 Tax=Streptococcus dysgalactiae TaxID=1334 RepID=A0A9X9QNS5_STRDY|nr:helix-turn-helix domain-containing protein [Streptococcus dysgalactiae]VTS17920.1 HTH-type transcriptional regulator AnsR family protein [Streptococcus dysgalactiae subsp. equisimilis]VTS46875.1 HTH-type transcriptional regulator AnsR family protein [Streptococcus dysgalactiae subsp. equisimilis]VTS77531.1 HTH-type transcriptional regulator AnsR family protein [Streptococcus dysgalactiae]